MFKQQTYKERRAELRRRMGGGLILLPGNDEAPANYFDNAYAFRQDSTFLYFFGQNLPGLFGVIDADSGEETLYGDDFTVDDIIWMGPQPSVAELGAQVGVSDTRPSAALEQTVRKAVRQGRPVHFLLPYRGLTQIRLARLLGVDVAALADRMSVDLIINVAAMREVKSAEEIEEMERAFDIGYRMHTTAMKMCRPGVTEREIAGAIEGVTKQYGWGVSFHSIVSQHGETLHNHCHDGVLESGRMLLCDAGGETVNNYCSDHTRTYPVGGRFSQRQKDVYEVVLAAHDHVAAMVAPGMMYRDVHAASYRVLAEGLVSLGLLRGNADDAVAAGAVSLFMPHGLGHGLGMDVHDCEAMGERGLRNFDIVAERAAEIDTCILRNNWRLRPGTVMTDEPGLYFIPAYAAKWRSEGKCRDFIDYDLLETYFDFGGVRIEDDILITGEGRRMLGGGRHIPVTVAEIEEFMGR